MPGRPPGHLVLGVVAALEDAGELTRAEICAALGQPKDKVAAVVSRMNRPNTRGAKRIYIARYTRHDDANDGIYLRAVYALGDLPDAKRPKPLTRKEIVRRHREAKHVRVGSIFDLAKPRRQREAEARARRLLKEAA